MNLTKFINSYNFFPLLRYRREKAKAGRRHSGTDLLDSPPPAGPPPVSEGGIDRIGIR